MTAKLSGLTFPTCPACGSPDIHRGAKLIWDSPRQEWVIKSEDETHFCVACEHAFEAPMWHPFIALVYDETHVVRVMKHLAHQERIALTDESHPRWYEFHAKAHNLLTFLYVGEQIL